VPLALAALLACPPAPAAASPPRDELVAEAAEAITRDPVYVAPDADLAGSVDRGQVEDAVRRARRDVYVAVLPGDSSRRVGPDIVARDLAEVVGFDGTYLVVVGRALRAASTDVEGAGRLAEQAVARHRGDTTAALVTAVREIDAAPADTGTAGGPGGSLLLLVLGALAVGTAALAVRRRRD
jgi:hypothetical protein